MAFASTDIFIDMDHTLVIYSAWSTHCVTKAMLHPSFRYLAIFMGGDLAPKLGGTKKFFRGPRFLNDVFFGKNFHFQGQNFFFSHRPGFWDFPFLFQHFPYVYYVKCPI